MKNKLKPITNPSKEQIEEYLSEIGWSLRGCGCDHFIFVNHKEERTSLMLWKSKMFIESKDCKTPSVTFYFEDIMMELLDNDCVSFCGTKNKNIFIQCMNYEKDRD